MYPSDLPDVEHHDSTARPPGPRPPSEFTEYAPRLNRLATLPTGHPQRTALREQLILALLPLGQRLAARHTGGNRDARADLEQVASIAVITAIDRWDPDRAEGDVLGYFVPCVRGELLRYFRDRTWSVRVPRRLTELTASIQRAIEPLTHTLGRAPRPSELARHLGVDVDDVVEALQAREHRTAVPLDAPSRSDEPALGDRLGDVDPAVESVADIATLRGLLDALPARERRIVRLRFYDDRTQSQIAADIGISQMHVSRLLNRTFATLQHALTTDD